MDEQTHPDADAGPADLRSEPPVGELADELDLVDSTGIAFSEDPVADEDLAGYLEDGE